MTLSITHKYVSSIVEGSDSGISGGRVGPSEWNSTHSLTLAGLSLLGTSGSGSTAADITGTTDKVCRVDTTGLILGFGAINLASSNAVAGNLSVSNLNSGTNAGGTTFWRGDGAWSSVTAAGTLLAANNLSDVASTVTARSNLGLVIGTNVQAWDTDLDALANFGNWAMDYTNGSGNWASVALGAVGNALVCTSTTAAPTMQKVLLSASNLSDVASTVTARSNLGLGSAALLSSAAVCQTANNLSDVASTVTTRSNLAALSYNSTAVISTGYTLTCFNNGNKSSGTFTPDPTQGNYQFYVNTGAHSVAVPANDCAIDLLITNSTGASTITFSGFTVGTTGDTYSSTAGNKYVASIRRINSVSTYLLKALQ